MLQVVSTTSTTAASTASGTPVATGLTVTITPTLASSKIYVTAFHSGAYVVNSAASVNCIAGFSMFRNATQLQSYAIGAESFPSSSNKIVYSPVLFSILDDPATTSATTYATKFNTAVASSVVTGAAGTQVDCIVAMEIGV